MSLMEYTKRLEEIHRVSKTAKTEDKRPFSG